MAHNYEDKGLPEGMELDEMHKHSDGESIEEVNATHRMTAGAGSSQEAYGGASRSGEEEVTSSRVQDSEPGTGTPREDEGGKVGAR